MVDNIYFSIKLIISSNAPNPLFVQQNKDELFLSAHGRLCGLDRLIHLETSDLAKEFMDAYLPRLRKRYGQDVSAEIIQCSFRGQSKQTLSRIKQDSELARKRIDTGILAPNQSPK